MSKFTNRGLKQQTLAPRKMYQGKRSNLGEVFVTVNGRALDPRFDLRFHSPDGFEWGYGGSGPAQLALALLADYLGDDEKAQRLYQEFKRIVVAGFAREHWILTSEQIAAAIVQLRQQGPEGPRVHAPEPS